MSGECECNGPGYCARHRMDKTEGLYAQCRTSVRYRALWDRRVGMTDDLMACDVLGERVGEIDKDKVGCGCPAGTPLYRCGADGEDLAIRRPAGWIGVEDPVVKLPAEFVHWDAARPDGSVSVRSCVACPKRVPPRPHDFVRLSGPWAVAVTTAPRKVPRLPETLASLQAAGWGPESVTVFGEPGSEVPTGWPASLSPVNLGGWKNFERALCQTLRDRPDAATVFMVQDDVSVSPDLRAMLETLELPTDCGMFSPYCPSTYRPALESQGTGPFRVFPGPFQGIKWFGMIGACTLAFPREVAEQLATHQFVREYAGHRWIDGVVGHTVHAIGRTTYFHWPSLALHTGDASTLHPGASATRHRQADSFEAGVSANQFLPNKPRADPKIGVIGWATASGLGRLNWMAATNLSVRRWLAPRHQRFPFVAPHPDCDMWYCQSTSNLSKLREFMRGLDMILCFELPYFPQVAEIAKRMNVRTVAVMMHECAPAGCRGWPQEFDLLIHPNIACRDILSPALPRKNHRMIRWPIDTEEIPFRQRDRADLFFFGQGTGGGSDRKGGNIVRQAAELTPNVPWLVRSQIVDRRMRIFEVEYQYPANVRVEGQVDDPADIYREGDVAVQVSRYEGMGLQLLEAKASGMPLVTTDAAPMNEYDPFAVIRATPRRTNVLRPTTAFDADPAHLAAVVAEIHGQDIAGASIRAREWVEANASWRSQGDVIRGAFVDLCFPR